MLNFKHKFIQWVPAILWGLFVSWLTLKAPSKSTLQIPEILAKIQPDKWVHFILWGIWTRLFIEFTNPNKKSAFTAAVFFSVYGVFIELLQGFMMLGRNCDFWDWLADTLGVCVALFLSRKLFSTNKN